MCRKLRLKMFRHTDVIRKFKNKLDKFVSRYRDSLAEAMNSLLARWDQYSLMYASSLYETLFSSQDQDGGDLVSLIALNWPGQVWYSDLPKLLSDTQWALPDCLDFLS